MKKLLIFTALMIMCGNLQTDGSKNLTISKAYWNFLLEKHVSFLNLGSVFCGVKAVMNFWTAAGKTFIQVVLKDGSTVVVKVAERNFFIGKGSIWSAACAALLIKAQEARELLR